VRLLWHSSYDRDECHNSVRDEIAALARESRRAACSGLNGARR